MIGSLEKSDRVRLGRLREGQVAKALTEQCNLCFEDSSHDEDCTNKIDRWLVRDGKRYGVQIKVRESGKDLLFELVDRFYGLDDPRNKAGRDLVQGSAEIYAVLVDKDTVVMIPTEIAKKIIDEALADVRQHGWTSENISGKMYRWNVHGEKIELKVQKDPRDHRDKLMAFIPVGVFEHQQQLETYKVHLPRKWH